MNRRVFSFDAPDRFICGAVGAPGQRTFFLQAVKGRQVISVALEKVQVAVLAERLALLLLRLREQGVAAAESTSAAIAPPPTPAALAEPLVEEFRVGSMVLSWDAQRERVVIEAPAACGKIVGKSGRGGRQRLLIHHDKPQPGPCRRKKCGGGRWARLARAGIGHWVTPEPVAWSDPGMARDAAGPLVADVQTIAECRSIWRAACCRCRPSSRSAWACTCTPTPRPSVAMPARPTRSKAAARASRR